MSFKTLRPQLQTLMENTNKFEEVSSSPKLEFNGFPACYIVPSSNEADYETNRENTRTYAFYIRAFFDTKNVGIGDAITAMEDLVDEVLNAIDQEDLKSGANRTLGASLPTNYTYLNVEATPSRWGELTEPALLMAEILVRVRVSIDVS